MTYNIIRQQVNTEKLEAIRKQLSMSVKQYMVVLWIGSQATYYSIIKTWVTGLNIANKLRRACKDFIINDTYDSLDDYFDDMNVLPIPKNKKAKAKG